MTEKPKSQPKKSQKQMILEHLMAGKRISSMKAYSQFNMTCLIQRVHDLKNAGVPIDYDWCTSKNGKRYKEFFISHHNIKTINHTKGS